MTLSGFLFARIVGESEVDFRAFALNRVLRLAPLLVVVLLLYLALDQTTVADLVSGFVLPTWPGGAWSIAAEIHFYIAFPILLFMVRRNGIASLGLLVLIAVIVRSTIWQSRGEVQTLAYWTIVGRIDQFVWGMIFGFLAARQHSGEAGRCVPGPVAATVFLGFLVAWHALNMAGGFYGFDGFPSPSLLWVILPSVEGAAYAVLIAWYSNAAFIMPTQLDRLLATLGTASYSIYLLHWPLRQPVADFFDRFGFVRGEFAQASILAVAFFLCVGVVSIGSYRFIERPFLLFRVNYLRRKSSPLLSPVSEKLS